MGQDTVETLMCIEWSSVNWEPDGELVLGNEDATPVRVLTAEELGHRLAHVDEELHS